MKLAGTTGHRRDPALCFRGQKEISSARRNPAHTQKPLAAVIKVLRGSANSCTQGQSKQLQTGKAQTAVLQLQTEGHCTRAGTKLAHHSHHAHSMPELKPQPRNTLSRQMGAREGDSAQCPVQRDTGQCPVPCPEWTIASALSRGTQDNPQCPVHTSSVLQALPEGESFLSFVAWGAGTGDPHKAWKREFGKWEIK